MCVDGITGWCLTESEPDVCRAPVCRALACPVLACPAVPCPAVPCPTPPCPALPCPALPCFTFHRFKSLQDHQLLQSTNMYSTRRLLCNMTLLAFPTASTFIPLFSFSNLLRITKVLSWPPHDTISHVCAGSSNTTSVDPPMDPQLVNVDWGVCECNQTMQVYF